MRASSLEVLGFPWENYGISLGAPLVHEASGVYLDRRSREVERDLEARLASLRAYRRRDPDFENAIAAFAEAEARIDDPIEGKPVETAGPIRQEIRRLLDA